MDNELNSVQANSGLKWAQEERQEGKFTRGTELSKKTKSFLLDSVW